MIIGFTGSQDGMNSFQRDELLKLFDKHQPTIVHHRGYKGSDKQFHDLYLNWSALRHIESKVIIHSVLEVGKSMSYFVEKADDQQVLEQKSYTHSGYDIVDACDLFIATPKEVEHSVRSGVWKTIQYAWKVKKNIVIIPPLFAEKAINPFLANSTGE